MPTIRPRSGVTLLQVIVPIAIIIGGLAVAAALFSMRPEAGQGDVAEVALPVETVTVQVGPAVAKVTGTGTVVADQQIVLTPQVGGRITSVSDDLRPGGMVSKGAVLARIDDRDYQLALTQAESQVAQARLNLEIEQSRGKVAEREWALVGEGKSASEAPLALRGPQRVNAEQALAATEAGLGSAKLALERTALRAPFDAVVLSEGVDIGQVVGAGTQAAVLVGTRRMRVEVQVPVEALPSLQIPGMGADAGSTATVTQQLTRGGAGQSAVVRSGQVIGLGGQIDPATRTATVLVGIDAPLGDGSGLPLLPGAFVDVSLAGRTVDQVIAVPRTGIRDGNIAWVVSPDGRLVKREVQIGWREADSLYVLSGLEAGERVVTSPLSLPIEGMAVREASATDGEADQ